MDVYVIIIIIIYVYVIMEVFFLDILKYNIDGSYILKYHNKQNITS